jgi:hypothetical protein
MRYTAWVALENEELRGCVLSDISDTGAKLGIDTSETLPDQFVLLLSRSGVPKRQCRVIWRNEGEIGVAFDRRHAHDQNAKLKQRPEVEALADDPETAPAD